MLAFLVQSQHTPVFIVKPEVLGQGLQRKWVNCSMTALQSCSIKSFKCTIRVLEHRKLFSVVPTAVPLNCAFKKIPKSLSCQKCLTNYNAVGLT